MLWSITHSGASDAQGKIAAGTMYQSIVASCDIAFKKVGEVRDKRLRRGGRHFQQSICGQTSRLGLAGPPGLRPTARFG